MKQSGKQLDKHIYSALHGSTEGTYITVKYTKSNTQEYNKRHVFTITEIKAMHERRSTTEYDLHTATLKTILLYRLAPPTDIYTKTPKEKEVATSLLVAVESLRRGPLSSCRA